MTQPNIILINCDDLGYGDLGSYGSKRNQSPHIDQLAREGLRFTDFYMASPVCSASRAAMMTGCYPPRIGFGPRPVLFPGEAIGLNPNETTIANQLKSQHYATKIIGKWHCGDQPEFLPTRQGFDEYFGIPYSNDMGRQINRQDSPPLPLVRNETVIQQQPDQRGITERYTDEALQFIHANKETPFFLYLAHMYVHVPLFVPQQFLSQSENGAYGGAVAAIDWSTGVLMNALEELGLTENTIVIFTSDNGSRARDEGGSNLPCRGTKATTWEGGQRVPCIIRWPARIKAGGECSAVARSIDFLPTLSSIVNQALPEDRTLDGVDLSQLWFSPESKAPNDSMVYYRRTELEAVRQGDWKLHFSKAGEPCDELYNLREDVGETTNLIEDQPEIVKALNAFADEVRQELGDERLGITGTAIRPSGKVANAKALTQYDENHPYMIAMYDLADMPTMSG